MKDEDLRKQAWDFFQMQAGQRLTTFNFYVVISSLLCTGLASSFKTDANNPYLGICFGLLLVSFSFAFWKLDHRNKNLIRSAENALKFFENQSSFEDENGMPHVVKRFMREEAETIEMNKSRTWMLWQNGYSYSECFWFVFTVFSLVGFAGATWSIFRLIGTCH
jgi:hypothetical protein